jgi:ubiquitin-like protein ATG12
MASSTPLLIPGTGTGGATNPPSTDPASMPGGEEEEEEEEEEAEEKEGPGLDLPMTMSASVILTHLPRDASAALAEVEGLDRGKGE